MSYINILNEKKDQVLTKLYSPNSDGVYSGYMNASSWFHIWGKENDGTIWGNVGQDNHVYEMDNTESAWNIWFPGQTLSIIHISAVVYDFLCLVKVQVRMFAQFG